MRKVGTVLGSRDSTTRRTTTSGPSNLAGTGASAHSGR